MPGVPITGATNRLVQRANQAAAERGSVPRGTLPNGSPPPNTAPVVRGAAGAAAAAAARPNNQPPPNAAAAPTPQQGGGQLLSLFEFLNQEQQLIARQQRFLEPDVYEIEFTPEWLAQCTIFKPGATNLAQVPLAPGSAGTISLLPERQSVANNMYTISFNAGTQIIQAVDEIMRNSSYVYDQQSVIFDSNGSPISNGRPAQSFAWFNIIGSVTPLRYDVRRNDFAYRIKFIVTTRETPVISEYFPLSKFRGVHKVYNYWFTGQNTQVLSFEQQINNAWRNTINNPFAAYEVSNQVNSRTLLRSVYQPNSDESNRGAAGNVNEPSANAADWLYNAKDYEAIKLKIVGDPAWINARNYQRASAVEFGPWLSDGSINYDASDAYFEFAWNTGVDYNLQTGLADVGANNAFADRAASKAGVAAQSLVYQAISCKSFFRGGKFEQELEGKLRLGLGADSAATASNQRPTNQPEVRPQAPTNATTNTSPIQQFLQSEYFTPPVSNEEGRISVARQTGRPLESVTEEAGAAQAARLTLEADLRRRSENRRRRQQEACNPKPPQIGATDSNPG
jgi:hypothetical protein